jgi:hypothetical protein
MKLAVGLIFTFLSISSGVQARSCESLFESATSWHKKGSERSSSAKEYLGKAKRAYESGKKDLACTNLRAASSKYEQAEHAYEYCGDYYRRAAAVCNGRVSDVSYDNKKVCQNNEGVAGRNHDKMGNLLKQLECRFN